MQLVLDKCIGMGTLTGDTIPLFRGARNIYRLAMPGYPEVQDRWIDSLVGVRMRGRGDATSRGFGF